ncbi:hypothetical protein HanPI659440_Chr06g0230221 [Helianthus annuus]|nr:hypothetical protein HanPI659440_Chr06g0230221 [Helianthus annuus]
MPSIPKAMPPKPPEEEVAGLSPVPNPPMAAAAADVIDAAILSPATCSPTATAALPRCPGFSHQSG